MPPTDGPGAGRVEYRVAGAAMRQAHERAAVAGIGPLVRAVLDAVLVLTVSYSKVTDETTLRQLARITYARAEVHGRERERVRDAVLQLDELGIITAMATGAGRGARLVVSVPMATLSVADETATDGVANLDDLGPDPMATLSGGNGHGAATEMATDGVAHLGNRGTTECPNGCDESGWIASTPTSGRYCELHIDRRSPVASMARAV